MDSQPTKDHVTASVSLWGTKIGAVWWRETGYASFEYTSEFVATGIKIAPLRMPLRRRTYSFTRLRGDSFKGLPGLLADSLPDKFGNALINAWLARQNRTVQSFNPVERLCYIGNRGIGALEFQPEIPDVTSEGRTLEVKRLVKLSSQILAGRNKLSGKLNEKDSKSMQDILQVGTSAGGARAKAVLLWNEKSGEFRSGQTNQKLSQSGFRHWLLKFDGVSENSNKELADPRGYGRVEYAYSLMAKDAGINMMPCRLYEEGRRAHFMTQRFDRAKYGDKLHYQSLASLMHLDYNFAGAHSYEQAMFAIAQLRLPDEDREQQLRRAAFNVIARNQDDHVKNIGFVMKPSGEWRLSPAFDITYNFNPKGNWTNRHQMTINQKRDDFVLDDLLALARFADIQPSQANEIFAQVSEVVAQWKFYAKQARVKSKYSRMIFSNLRLDAFAQ